MSQPFYIMRDGSVSYDQREAKKKRRDEEYSLLRHYKNATVRVKIEWVGGPFVANTPLKATRPFKLTVWNITAEDYEGRPYDQPKETEDPNESMWCATEQEAVNAYESFLISTGTGCEWMRDANGDPRFVERGNSLAPPSKDLPQAPVENDERPPEVLAAIGSW